MIDKLINYFNTTSRHDLLTYKYPNDLSGHEWNIMYDFTKILKKLQNQMEGKV